MKEGQWTQPHQMADRSPTDEEYTQLDKLVAKTLCPPLSNYGRRVLLQKPVNIRYRNRSLNDFVTHMLLLRRKLNAVGTGFNKVAHRFHTLHNAVAI